MKLSSAACHITTDRNADFMRGVGQKMTTSDLALLLDLPEIIRRHCPWLTQTDTYPVQQISVLWGFVRSCSLICCSAFLMPLDCLRGKSGAFSPSLPKGHVTMRVMLPPFALCVRFFCSIKIPEQPGSRRRGNAALVLAPGPASGSRPIPTPTPRVRKRAGIGVGQEPEPESELKPG